MQRVRSILVKYEDEDLFLTSGGPRSRRKCSICSIWNDVWNSAFAALELFVPQKTPVPQNTQCPTRGGVVGVWGACNACSPHATIIAKVTLALSCTVEPLSRPARHVRDAALLSVCRCTGADRRHFVADFPAAHAVALPTLAKQSSRAVSRALDCVPAFTCTWDAGKRMSCACACARANVRVCVCERPQDTCVLPPLPLPRVRCFVSWTSTAAAVPLCARRRCAVAGLEQSSVQSMPYDSHCATVRNGLPASRMPRQFTHAAA